MELQNNEQTLAQAFKDLTTRPPQARIDRIHLELQKGKYPNSRQLAVMLELKSHKTVQRDIRYMQDRLHMPIDYDPRKKGYYYTSPVDKFPSTYITAIEVQALVIALKCLEQLRGMPFEKPLRRAVNKVLKNLPDSISCNLADWNRAISFHQAAEVIFDANILAAFINAAAGRKQLKILYRSLEDAAHRERVVDPYRVSCVNGEWYIFARSHEHDLVRTYIPARTRELEETGVTFELPKDFDLDERLARSFGVHTGDEEIDVIVQFRAKVAQIIRERRWRGFHAIKELPNGGVELHLKLSTIPEVQRWIQGYGRNARVIAPTELKESIRCEALAVANEDGAAW